MPPLDQNLYTLKFKRSEEEPGALDLIDHSQLLAYRKRIVPPSAYKQEGADDEAADRGLPLYDMWDPLSDSLLSTLSASPATSNKKKNIQLYNPNVDVNLRFTGSMSFRWQFDWESHTFEIKREECFMLRRPDPPVLVAVYDFSRKQTRNEVGSLQLLDYNLTRFDIDDRKGLEIVMITSILSFQEAITGQPDPLAAIQQAEPSSGSMISRVTSLGSPVINRKSSDPPPPSIPPKEIGLKVAGLQILEKSAPNEMVVSSMFEVEEYAEHACKLLGDNNMLYIVVRSKTAAEVPKVIATASLIKRMRYKGGAHDEELHQYAKYSEEEEKKGPRVIKLDEPAGKDPSKAYRPPTALSIHLSKIPMPELQPRARPGNSSTSHSRIPSGANLHVPEPSGGSSNTSSRFGRSGRSSSPLPSQDPPANNGGGKLKKGKVTPSSSPTPQGPAGVLSSQQPLYPGGGYSRPPTKKNSPAPPIVRPPQPQQGPASPRTSFMGFYSPGAVPSGSHQQPQRPHPSNPSPQTPASAMPGSYFPGPPPPPPPQQQQQQAGSSGGLSSFIGGILPGHGSTHGGAAPQSVSEAAKVVGHMGMQMYERFAKSK